MSLPAPSLASKAFALATLGIAAFAVRNNVDQFDQTVLLPFQNNSMQNYLQTWQYSRDIISNNEVLEGWAVNLFKAKQDIENWGVAIGAFADYIIQDIIIADIVPVTLAAFGLFVGFRNELGWLGRQSAKIPSATMPLWSHIVKPGLSGLASLFGKAAGAALTAVGQFAARSPVGTALVTAALAWVGIEFTRVAIGDAQEEMVAGDYWMNL